MKTRLLLFSVVVAALLFTLAFAWHPSGAENVLAARAEAPAEPEVEVSGFLLDQLTTAQGPVSFLVLLQDQAEPAMLATLARAAAAGDPDLEPHIAARAAVYGFLTDHAARSQAPLRAWLDAQDIPYRPYYLVNMLEVHGDAAVLTRLRARPEVARIVANPLIDQAGHLAWEEDYGVVAATFNPNDPPDTGVEYVLAPLVWEMGYRGQGIVVASGDTGAEWTHPSLRPRYRGWDASAQSVTHDRHFLDAWKDFDPALDPNIGPNIDPDRDPCADAQGACDDWGHGTHTIGTMVGALTPAGRRIGMAPDAQWIACRNMLLNYGTPAKYTDCFQFFLAPYPQGGDPFTDGDPALGADVINNSWGCPPSEGCDANSLRDVIETIKAAGIFVTASAGNSGPGCGSVNTPPGHHAAAFSVGAHNLAGTVALFSSRGPVGVDGSGRLKPDLAAPGVGIHSAYRGGYVDLSGTSMAAPHVAGAVALLWSAVPALRGNVVMTEEILLKSATRVLNNTCDGNQPPTAPNNTYGYGRLNAYEAVRMALTPWAVGIRVLDRNSAPLADIPVILTDELTGLAQTTRTGADGWARWQPIYQGAYLCAVELPPDRLGSSAISLLPTPLAPNEDLGDGSLTVGSCRAATRTPDLIFLPAVGR